MGGLTDDGGDVNGAYGYVISKMTFGKTLPGVSVIPEGDCRDEVNRVMQLDV